MIISWRPRLSGSWYINIDWTRQGEVRILCWLEVWEIGVKWNSQSTSGGYIFTWLLQLGILQPTFKQLLEHDMRTRSPITISLYLYSYQDNLSSMISGGWASSLLLFLFNMASSHVEVVSNPHGSYIHASLRPIFISQHDSCFHT